MCTMSFVHFHFLLASLTLLIDIILSVLFDFHFFQVYVGATQFNYGYLNEHGWSY